MNNLLLVILVVLSTVGAFAAVRWQAEQHIRVESPGDSSARGES
jgi:hypothetical protein